MVSLFITTNLVVINNDTIAEEGKYGLMGYKDFLSDARFQTCNNKKMFLLFHLTIT
jgi:hypothetical protein